MLKKKLFVLASLAVLGQVGAHAGTGYYLVSTYPEEGRKSIDFKYWNAKPDGQPPRSSPELGFGYNVSSRWYTELTAAWFKLSPGAARFSALEWQNDYMLTEGQYPFDLALHTNIERSQNRARGDAFEIGPVMQTEIGRTQFNLNVFLERSFHLEVAEPTELKYQWQVKYRWKPKLEFGLQGFGEVGDWRHWLPRARQSHRAGPALFGTWHLEGRQELKYEGAYLMGKNSARSANSVTMRVQYGF